MEFISSSFALLRALRGEYLFFSYRSHAPRGSEQSTAQAVSGAWTGKRPPSIPTHKMDTMKNFGNKNRPRQSVAGGVCMAHILGQDFELNTGCTGYIITPAVVSLFIFVTILPPLCRNIISCLNIAAVSISIICYPIQVTDNTSICRGDKHPRIRGGGSCIPRDFPFIAQGTLPIRGRQDICLVYQ